MGIRRKSRPAAPIPAGRGEGEGVPLGQALREIDPAWTGRKPEFREPVRFRTPDGRNPMEELIREAAGGPPDLQDLEARYPQLYRKGMFFECGPGWYGLLDRLSAQLEANIVAIQARGDLDAFDLELIPAASQVKEKFGGLRFYLEGNYPPEMGRLVEEAECLSFHVCEVCGEQGELKGYQVRCSSHRT